MIGGRRSIPTTVGHNVHRWYAPQAGAYASTDPLGLRSGPNPFSYARSAPLRNRDRLGLVWEAASCDSCCTAEARRRELQQMVQYAAANREQYDNWPSQGCGASSRALADHFNRGIGVRCWVVRDQLVDSWFLVGVHSVVRMRPCGDLVVSGDKYMDLWRGLYGEPIIEPQPFHAAYGGRELDSEDVFYDPSRMPVCQSGD